MITNIKVCLGVCMCVCDRVIFTTEEGMTCVCDLGNIINVTFEDVFQPLPSSPIPYQVSGMEHGNRCVISILHV